MSEPVLVPKTKAQKPFIGIHLSAEPVRYRRDDCCLQVAAYERRWTQSEAVGWVWRGLRTAWAEETDLTGYAARQVAELVAAWETMQSSIQLPGRNQTDG